MKNLYVCSRCSFSKNPELYFKCVIHSLFLYLNYLDVIQYIWGVYCTLLHPELPTFLAQLISSWRPALEILFIHLIHLFIFIFEYLNSHLNFIFLQFLALLSVLDSFPLSWMGKGISRRENQIDAKLFLTMKIIIFCC